MQGQNTGKHKIQGQYRGKLQGKYKKKIQGKHTDKIQGYTQNTGTIQGNNTKYKEKIQNTRNKIQGKSQNTGKHL